jgi:ribosome modulation factor
MTTAPSIQPMRAATSDSRRSLRAAHGLRRDPSQTDKILKQDVRSWHEGYRAGVRGAGNRACPHQAASTESWSWASGFIEGEAARLKNDDPVLDDTRKH